MDWLPETTGSEATWTEANNARIEVRRILEELGVEAMTHVGHRGDGCIVTVTAATSPPAGALPPIVMGVPVEIDIEY